MKELWTSIKVFVFFTLLTGILYPVAIYYYAQWVVPDMAEGSLRYVNQELIGSELLGQEFTQEKYFWGRPSASHYDGIASGSSHLSLNSKRLVDFYEERKKYFKESSGSIQNPPQDLLFSSASGLDPHISPESALYQVGRVAKARGLDSQFLRELIEGSIEKPQYGILGLARVNVFRLNCKLNDLK